MRHNFVIGDPVDHSLSPTIHNTAYKLLDIQTEYNFSAKKVSHENLANFVKEFEEKWHGLAVTIPHKQAIVTLIDEIDEAARAIGAVNTVVNKNGLIIGHNTDWMGAQKALERIVRIKNKKVALLGTGGSARAIAYAMAKAGAQLTIFGRDDQKTIAISNDFGAMPARIQATQEIANHDIIINATSVGLDENIEIELLPAAMLNAGHIVFDIVYGRQTKLSADAKAAGAKIITGLEMLIEQALPQIKILTEHKISSSELRQALKDKL